MKERRGLGHDDEINLQVAIAKGLALLLQRMPRIAALHRQEAILRLRRHERPLHEEPARPEDLQGHLRRGRRQNRLHRLRRRGEGAVPPPHIRVRRLAEGRMLRTHRQEVRLRRLPKRQGANCPDTSGSSTNTTIPRGRRRCTPRKPEPRSSSFMNSSSLVYPTSSPADYLLGSLPVGRATPKGRSRRPIRTYCPAIRTSSRISSMG